MTPSLPPSDRNSHNAVNRRSLRRLVLTGALTSLFLVLAIGVWARTAKLDGAVIASGIVVVESSIKKVQHQAGGIVGEIRVKDGMRVEEGDLLVRLDDTLTRANLAVILQQLIEFQARLARLEAERDGEQTVATAPALTDRASEPEIVKVVKGERNLFEARRRAQEGQRKQLNERTLQIAEEIRGLEAQAASKRVQTTLIKKELVGVADLERKNLVPLSRLTSLEREASRLGGEEGQLVSDIAKAKGRIAETQLQIIQVDQDLQKEVATELRDVQAKIAELTERKVAAEDQLKRIEIRSPQSGLVHQLAIHTVGGVVAPGDTLMMIVPETDALIVESRISPQDIDSVHAEQEAMVRLSAFNHATTPELRAKVVTVSADLTKDKEQPNVPPYYVARIVIPEAELNRLDGKKLLPGMPAEAYIQTGERTALNYIMKPLIDRTARAFREK